MRRVVTRACHQYNFRFGQIARSLGSSTRFSYGAFIAMKLVVTIPAQNEEKTIAQVIRDVPRDIAGIDDVEVIVVNDGSTDRTAAEALDAGAIVINVSGRPGLGR